ncbi:SIS domain-containing protein [Spirochaeta lutea]|uniref:Glutamine--fructose-6-phosphate aminotransferase [isomerizing] n=1 Tax=Spirochaeta lutea TaxID=1480694 RepID=A0A098QUZ5_9SPIO|nr:hypothetical protein [Spirochaeta lutea]KGE71554.1 hypothetical protein DC28_09665 [Spirochaeta lutea]
MNNSEPRYTAYNLSREMLETPGVVRRFKIDGVREIAEAAKGFSAFFLTGEGSSRIFPAKRAMYQNFSRSNPLWMSTEGSTQAMEYNLDHSAVFGASNSGKTKELLRLFYQLKDHGHTGFFGVTANDGTPLVEVSKKAVVLSCGPEQAVAATKSVMEQALVYHGVFSLIRGEDTGAFEAGLKELADAMEEVLGASLGADKYQGLVEGSMIYFAGRNNGVAEELTLKTNEITRKKSSFLEGTYAVHGIEEVMRAGEALVLVDPFEAEEEKFEECLVTGAGVVPVAISHRETRFPTIRIPKIADEFMPYLQMAAGWSLLLEAGLDLGINLDKPERARKVGNEFSL